MLELYAGKLARTVLWGPGGRKTSRLPDHFDLTHVRLSTEQACVLIFVDWP